MPDGSWWAGDGPLPYAACYCEENAWQLCARARRLGRDLPGFFVVFISNPARTVRLFKQRAGRDHMGHVIWDYHVVVIVQSADRSIVYDQDTTMTPFPIDFETMFRVVPAERYLADFSSDRSHMATSDASPPPWKPIWNGLMNLDTFIDMPSSDPEVHSFGQLMNRFSRAES
ncbi:unnamed protein product (mitochondrion) [Plasmodiophora brassicae]|uniref:Protein N-terminal glutamine amidohydrolase n=1 Tax=Plasmodiophora brassicae TaxID=37360 RepID=A0A3P3Y841_PLABS|nr:unnamed protein product [Plasmodiophora brassicae]